MVRKYLQDARARVARLWALLITTVATVDAIASKRIADGLFRLALALRGWPQIAGADDGDDDADKDDDKDADADKDDDDDSDKDDADKDDDKDADKTDWKSMARKHERRAKAEKKRADDLAAKQQEIDDAAKTEQQKAVDKAREEATNEVTSKYETERRAERLELAVTRQATKGVKIGDGDDAKTVKFADPDDAMAHLERAIKRGDIDGDDIFDENGKVQKDALTAALVELLEDKPHLAAKSGGSDDDGDRKDRRAKGDSDAGKGKGGGKALDEMSPADHLKAIQNK